MNSFIWGPDAWSFLHTITFNYPQEPTQEDIDSHYYFFTYLGDVLPCPKCQNHYKENLVKHPINLDSREEFIQWLITMHNEVNITNGKPTWTYDQVFEKYKHLYTDTETTNTFVKTCKKQYPKALLLIIVCLAIYILHSKKIISFK